MHGTTNLRSYARAAEYRPHDCAQNATAAGSEGITAAPSWPPRAYRAVLDEGRVLPELVRRFVDGVLGGSSQPLVQFLAGQKPLSAKDVQDLKRIAAKIGQEDAPQNREPKK